MSKLEEFCADLLRYGFIIHDSEGEEVDWLNEDIVHYTRYQIIIIGKERYHLRKMDGKVVEVECDITHEKMMENSKYRTYIEDKIRENYGEEKLMKWKKSI